MESDAGSLVLRGPARPVALARASAWLEREAFVVAVVALYGVLLLALMPYELVQDSWSTLVAGREVAHHGLPQRETLTVMADGARWVDQQWLAQLGFYGLHALGGMKLALLAHVALLVGAFALGASAARRLGASPVSVFVVAGVTAFVAPWGWQLRAQSFAYPLFVLVLWLLAADARRPSARVFLALPLLALWANVHGSVVLGALLVVVGASIRAFRPGVRRLESVVLIVAAPLCLLASPYGLPVVGYYRRMLFNPVFGRMISEWKPATPAPLTAIFLALCLASLVGLVRYGRRLTWFERLALLGTMAAGLDAVRNVVWFGLTALVVLPLVVEEARGAGRGGARASVRLALGLAASGALAAALAAQAARPAGSFVSGWPAPAARIVAQRAAADPGVRVFASERYADWLLWSVPSLAGRVAFDVRFELNTRAQVTALYDYFRRHGSDWQRPALGYGLIVLDRTNRHLPVSAFVPRDASVVYLDHDVAVLSRRGRG